MSSKEEKINLLSVRRKDECAKSILSKFPQVVLYGYDSANSTWERKSMEGALFIYSRSGGHSHGLFLLNRLSSDNMMIVLVPTIEFMVKERFVMIKEQEGEIFGMCFSNKETAKRCGRDIQHLLNGGDESSLPSKSASSQNGLEERPSSTQTQETSRYHGQWDKYNDPEQRFSKPRSTGARKPGRDKRQRLSRSSSESNDAHRHHSNGSVGRSSSGSPVLLKVNHTSDSEEMTAAVKRKLFSGSTPPITSTLQSASPPPQRLLSLEEVERSIWSEISPPDDITLTHRPTQTTPIKQSLPPSSTAGVAILGLLSSSKPSDTLSPVMEVPSPSTLSSPLIGTSQDFPEKPPLMVSAGMKSEPVHYTSKSQPSPAKGGVTSTESSGFVEKKSSTSAPSSMPGTSSPDSQLKALAKPTPVGSGHTPVVSGHTSVVSGHTPVGSGQTSVVSRHTPVGSGHASVGSGHTSVGSGHTPVGSGHTSVGSGHTSVPSFGTPRKGAKLMSPGDFSKPGNVCKTNISSASSNGITPSTSGKPIINGVTTPSTSGTPIINGVTTPSTSGTPIINGVTTPSTSGIPTISRVTTPSTSGTPTVSSVTTPSSTSSVPLLTKEQLRATLIRLLQNDDGFINKIHQAYQATATHQH